MAVPDVPAGCPTLETGSDSSLLSRRLGVVSAFRPTALSPLADMATALPVPWSSNRLTALPPGCPEPQLAARKADPGLLQVLYVGSVIPPLYNLSSLLEAVRQVDGVLLTVCCPPSERQRAFAGYSGLLDTRVQVLHEHGVVLDERYRSTDLAIVVLGPNEYHKFAMPLRLFEAVGYGLPVVAAAGTAVGNLVRDENLGWTISSTERFVELRRRLRANPSMVEQRRVAVSAARARHTWRVRAHKVAEVLTAADG